MARYSESALFLSRCGVLLLLYGIWASIALANLGAIMALLFWGLSLQWKRSWQRMRALPSLVPLLLLPLGVLIGSLYSIAPFDYSYKYFGAYSRLLLILVIVSVIDDRNWQTRSWISFFLGAFVTLGSTYLGIWWPLPWSKSSGTGIGENHSVFYDYIAQGIATTFLAVVALARILAQHNISQRAGWLALLAVSVFSITHLLYGRTGQLVCLLSLMCLVLAALPFRKSMALLLGIIATTLILYQTSPVMPIKFGLLFDQIQEPYEYGQEINSINVRVAMWMASLNFFLEQPIWGHGTGSYRWLSERTFLDPIMCSISCVHPHNQFLFFGVEHGIVSVMIYLWLLFSLVQIARKVDFYHSLLLIGLLCMIIVDSFINSPLWISSERNFYTAVLGLTLTSFFLNSKEATLLKESKK